MEVKRALNSFFDIGKFKRPDSFFYLQKFGWRYLGLSFESDEWTVFQMTLLAIHCCTPIFYGLFQFTFFIKNRNNLLIIADALTPFLTQIPIVMRTLFIAYHRKKIARVLKYLRNFFETASDSSEIDMIARANRLATVLLGILCIGVVITAVFFLSFPILGDIYRVMINEEKCRNLPFKIS
jgi:hypothetical protein